MAVDNGLLRHSILQLREFPHSISAVISCDELRPSPDFAGLAAHIVTRRAEPHVFGQPRLGQGQIANQQ